jgi:hypothetical protein
MTATMIAVLYLTAAARPTTRSTAFTDRGGLSSCVVPSSKWRRVAAAGGGPRRSPHYGSTVAAAVSLSYGDNLNTPRRKRDRNREETTSAAAHLRVAMRTRSSRRVGGQSRVLTIYVYVEKASFVRLVLYV